MKIIVDEQQANRLSATILCSGPDLSRPGAIDCHFVPVQTVGQNTNDGISMWPVCPECFRVRLVAIANAGNTPVIGSLDELLDFYRKRLAERRASR